MELVDRFRANHYLRIDRSSSFILIFEQHRLNLITPYREGPVLAPQEARMKIERNRVVAIQYTLKDDAGRVIDTSEGRDPLQYLHGNNNLIPGLEKALEGLEAGKQIQVTVPPEEGYGPRVQEMVQEVPKKLFENEDLAVGMQFQVQGEDGVHILTIAEIRDESVIVDGNHPLAGANLNFDVTVVSVREASPEEIAHGHVH